MKTVKQSFATVKQMSPCCGKLTCRSCNKGNTGVLLKYVLAELAAEGIDTELVSLAEKKIQGCIACYKCFEKKDKKCSGRKDDLNAVLEKMVEADGILLGSPTYFSNVTPEIKALIDRAGLVGTANGGMFARKAGAAVVAVRRAGSVFVFDAINHFFLYSQMIVPGSSYWNVGIGLEPGDVEKDREGICTMKTLGKNMAWLLKKCGE